MGPVVCTTGQMGNQHCPCSVLYLQRFCSGFSVKWITAIFSPGFEYGCEDFQDTLKIWKRKSNSLVTCEKTVLIYTQTNTASQIKTIRPLSVNRTLVLEDWQNIVYIYRTVKRPMLLSKINQLSFVKSLFEEVIINISKTQMLINTYFIHSWTKNGCQNLHHEAKITVAGACWYQKNIAETNVFTTRKAAEDIIQGSVFISKIKFVTDIS